MKLHLAEELEVPNMPQNQRMLFGRQAIDPLEPPEHEQILGQVGGLLRDVQTRQACRTNAGRR